ncbi:polysaccharide deacetylase family protein [Nonomuraea sp. H19]|uniref:polysaccharide deacetylase family protein n=1 Tax=Nonomuraea sp. H19 TaxID=3452206 RepID=UPI003F88BB5F
MHKTRFFSGIALLALSAGGCGWTGTSSERDVMVPAEPTLIDFADPATVTGLTTRTLTEGDSPTSRYVHITYPELADAPALNRALRAQAERQLKDFRARTGTGPKGPRPELNVEWQLAAVTPQAIAVRLRTGEFLGATWGNSTQTYWYDRRNGKALESTGLLDGKDALRRLAVLVKDGLKVRGPQVEQDEVTADGDQFDSMAFNRNGDLVVEFDDCQIGPCSLGRLAVAVPAEQAAPLLSGLGRRAQDSVREQANVPHDEPPVAPTTRPDALSSRAGTVDCAKTKCVALTFDDGPGPHTGRLLDLLREHRARATFFTVGTSAAAQPGLLRRMSQEGHLVGNHTWAHRDLSKQTTSKIADSLEKTQDVIAAATGQAPTLVRPPYGAVSQDVRDVTHEMGLALVTWDVDTEDLRGAESAGEKGTPEDTSKEIAGHPKETNDDAKDIADRAVRGAHPGAIILMHDIDREAVDVLPAILKGLRGKGYTFVTVSELYGSAGMQAGRLYRSGSELRVRSP